MSGVESGGRGLLLRLATVCRVLGSGLLALLSLAAGHPVAAEAYRLAPTDQVEIIIFEYPGVGGLYTVDGDGTVAIPLLGATRAAGRTPSELAAAVAAAVAAQNGNGPAPIVSARVAQYRPVYVVGEVDQPGAYPYHPGMTVIEAVALAGGPYRASVRGTIDDLGRLDVLAQDRLRTRLRIARLQSEQTRAETVEFPADLSPDSPATTDLRERENAIFVARRDFLERRIESLGRLKDQFAVEIEALEDQLELKASQVNAYDIELARSARTETPTARALELQRARADAESQRLDLFVQLQRARQSFTQADQDILQTLGGREAEVADALNAAEAQLARTESEIATTRNLLLAGGAVDLASVLSGANATRSVLAYRVLAAGGKTRERAAIETDALMPGDVLKVEQGGGDG